MNFILEKLEKLLCCGKEKCRGHLRRRKWDDYYQGRVSLDLPLFERVENY